MEPKKALAEALSIVMPDRAAIVSSFFNFIVIHPLVEVSVRCTYLFILDHLLVIKITAEKCSNFVHSFSYRGYEAALNCATSNFQISLKPQSKR
ncbi:hypothetical protein IFVP18_C2110275 [Vibrio parahaemolyticus]